MIHVISSMNRHLYEGAIETHFHIRHDIFVGERRWEALARADGKEIDSCDNADTVYLLAMEGNRIIGGHRLCPTTGPTMIDQVFPNLAAVRGVPSDPLIWECSRFFVVRDRREGRVHFELMAAVQEFCLDEGITHVKRGDGNSLAAAIATGGLRGSSPRSSGSCRGVVDDGGVDRDQRRHARTRARHRQYPRIGADA
jgi:hypothetical protein